MSNYLKKKVQCAQSYEFKNEQKRKFFLVLLYLLFLYIYYQCRRAIVHYVHFHHGLEFTGFGLYPLFS